MIRTLFASHGNNFRVPEGMVVPPQLRTGGDMFFARSNMLIDREPIPGDLFGRAAYAMKAVEAWSRRLPTRGSFNESDVLLQWDYERNAPDVTSDNIEYAFSLFRAWFPNARIVGYRTPEKHDPTEVWEHARDHLAALPVPRGPDLVDCHLYLGDLIGDNEERVKRVVDNAIERVAWVRKPVVCQTWFQTTGRRGGTWLDAPTVRYLCERVHEAHKRGEFNTDEVYFTVSGGAGAYTDSPNEFNDWINEIAADVGEVFAETA